ncbi:interferon-induced very large GTPase 1-like [Haemorhous mexicanus]|uniref:interferon-induced very large GTPase 1-like n=1 Tax=Haemorhous mexicanus TaxID=30427 RepID=UPI0028BEBB30|nr:interferon-induced very large GTPase 1-like [Haemorhous mexicanus]XP_059699168.1 interferon-induced very large GTPase 1-like [Haemorhous mexicanus]XP_059699169.1 interferon-induced very large GTPase 1-like [Haemorhous mexicanus]XP_059699170.1 interferon-induced very large GTPase 1-like [Haemorhous mexicanus]
MALQEDTQEEDAKAQVLAEAFEKEGLDAGYWVPKVTQILGIKCREALQHLEYEDYLRLECEVRHPWEKKALQELLKITDDKMTTKGVQKEHLEKKKQRQDEAKKALKDLTEMLNSHSHSQDALREKAETLWRAMEIPKEFWPPAEKPLADMLESIQKQLEQQEQSAGRRENIPDTEVLRRASGGLALQGIYRTSRPEDVLAKREQLLRVPEGFQLAGPEQGSLLERKEFSSSAAESTFTKSMEQLGFSMSVSAKCSFWGFNLGGSVDHSSFSQSQDTHQSRSVQSYFCTTKYQYIPLASCYFQRHQLRLSDAALQELQGMEQLLSFSQEGDKAIFRKMSESFFSRFGSHINQGPLHFGGIFWWKASTEGFRAEQREEMKRETTEALNSFVGASWGGFGASVEGTLDVSKSTSQASVLGRARESSHTAIQLYVVNSGGPADTASLPQWKTGLVSDNTTWCVIDRGFQLIPVWEVILCNHCGDFKSVGQMSRALRAAYKALTNLSVGTIFGEELGSAVQEARDFMGTVKAWEVTEADEEKMLMLMGLKDDLNAKTQNPSVWINVCLSDKALQDFLVNTVRSCQESPPENSTSIKVKLRSLLNPHIYSVKDFPEASFIMQWIFQTEQSLPRSPKVSELQELIKTLQQMKEHIHAVTYAPGSSASAVHEAKIKATQTSSLAIYSLLQSLKEQAQKDMELLVLLIVTSTGYQVESSTFQHLLGHPEIQYMAKEMEAAHAEYVNLKEQDADRAEAFLLLTGLTVTSESQELSLEQKRERLVFMEDHMKGLWSTRIKNLLQKHHGDEDWERLEWDLESLISGCLDDKWDEQRLQNIVKDLEDTLPTPEALSHSQSKSESSESRENEAISNHEFLQLLRHLGLESHYPRKMGMGDFHTICKTSLQDSQPSQDTELPLYFLQKLLTVDYQVRYLTCWDDSNPNLAALPQTTAKEDQQSENFEQFFGNLAEAAPEPESRDSHVHPMDLQMAIFHCADDFLRQTLATKLAFCQLALPLLVPSLSTSLIEFPLYALSQIQRSWKEVDKSGKQAQTKSYNNKLIFQAQTPIVSFIRIGSSASSSKSQLLNAVLNKHKHNTFFDRHCRGSTRERLLMEGLVEIAWYCPRGSPNDTFECCVAFCNLHGDARDHGAQLQFLQEISAVNVALVSELEHMDNRGKQLLQDLWQSQRPLVCLLTEIENAAAGQVGKNIKIGIKNRNEAELIVQLTKIIRDLLEGSNSCFSLEACMDKARQHGFIVDADQPACVTAKAKAKELMELLKKEKLSEIKSRLLPLQGKLWYQWCRKDKELTRLQEKRNKSIEHHRSDIENEKKAIRGKQLEQAFPLNPLMKSFLEFLHAQPADTKKYFLHWMKVFMDELSCGRLEELRRDYHEVWSEILSRKKSKKKPSCDDELLSRLDAISDEINDSSIGLEHLLREVGQIYEALQLMNSKNANFDKLPEIAAELMVSGYPVELMDGDASYLPLRWVGAIFDSLIERLGDKRVFVLSVLGIQSTGKSTLLNAMFGLQFNVSAGRCTRGAFMQLIPVGEELQQDLGFDFVLVVDTEGLRAIEMANKQSLNHDNELATFVIGVGNLTVINIFGENPSEMQDVLQIAVQAFLRMKQVNLSPGCLFVHQNVGEATAKEQNMEGQRRLQEKLDEMTVVAAQQEFCDISSFSDVIGFDVNTHIHYFAHLWEGNPPMAPPNPTYSQNVQELKSKILQAAKKQSQCSILRFSSLKDRIGDLWNALLNENFVFSFKNSLEIAVYRKLESAFSQWTWKLRSHILDVQMRLDNKIRNGDMQNVTREHLEGLVQETSDAIEKEVEKYFREDKDCETLVQWKSSTELKLKDLKETLLLETKKKCENLIELQKEQRKLDARKLSYEDELLRRSRELAVSLKGKSLSERELKDNFTLVWNQWIAEVSRAARPPERVDIDAEIEDVLVEQFKEPGFPARLRSFPRGRGFSFDPEKHIMKKKYFGIFPGFRSLSNADMIKFQHITDNIIACVKANIAKKEEEKRDYSRNFIHEILNEVQKGVSSVPSDGKCTFNRDYSIDLSLYLCRMAAERFKAMHEAFQKANDPVVYLSSKREYFFQCFQISCQGATSVTTFVVFFCDKIEPALHRAVYERTAKDIAEDMQGKFPDFQGSRANLEVCILRYLAEEENFEYFKQYLTSPKQFCESYIETQVRNYCLDGSRRLKMFLDSSLDILYKNLLSAVSLSTQIVKDRKDREDKVSLWLDEFCRQLTEVINLPRSDLKGIEHQEVTDIEFLSSAMAEALDDLRDKLMNEFAGADLSSFSRQPHTILAEHFSGCWEQCPFCGAVCTNTMWNHDGDHQLVYHRPQGLNGWRWHETDHLAIDICSSDVASDCTFSVRDNEVFPYKRYRDAGPPFSTWNILPDSSMQAYWKWFVSHFRTQLEALYNGKFQGKGKIPEAWRRVTKQEALSDLEKR